MFFLLELVIILVVANIGGLLAQKAKMPGVLGQILAGVIIGPAILNIIQGSTFIEDFAQIGVVLLMFIAGLETEVSDLKASGKSALLIATGGIVVQLVLGFFMMQFLRPEVSFNEKVFVGTILTATSVSISVQVLKEMKMLRSKVGLGIIGAAIVDDVLGIVLVTVVVGIISPTTGTSLVQVLLQIVGFFIVTGLMGLASIKLMKKYHSFFNSPNRILTISILFCFGLAVLAQELGVSAVIGAYFTGVVFSSTHFRNTISNEVQKIAYTLFIPVFFLHIGLLVSVTGIRENIILVIVFIIVSILSKIIGCSLGAKISHFSLKESFQIGVGMIPRVEVPLIVTNIGLTLGVIKQEIFVATILVVLSTTLVTPILLKLVLKPENESSVAKSN